MNSSRHTNDATRRIRWLVVATGICIASHSHAIGQDALRHGFGALSTLSRETSQQGDPLGDPPAAQRPNIAATDPPEFALADPPDQGAWWKPLIMQRQRATPGALRITLDSLLLGALRHSAQIQVISDAPLISETAITTADSVFDWTSFLEARWDDISEPVGNILTTGGPPRFRDHVASFEIGVRRRNTLGGELEMGQRYGFQNNNSIYFIPNDQGTSRLTLSYTQPLLRGAGGVYNTSLTVLAKIDAEIAQDEFSRQLQEQLLEITRAYWTLYLERGKLLQRQRLLARGQEILDLLESRREVDALQSQIVRARSAVASRRADLVRANFDIRTAEARVRSLINDPRLGDTVSTELLPLEQFSESPFPVELRQSVAQALQQRPEIDQAVKQVKAACVRMNMSKRESLPLLNFVMETYLAGLEGDSSIGRAFEEQFSKGEPSYSLGLQYEYPIWNRGATSKVQRRRLELRRLQNQFRSTVETLKLEVEVAVHAVNSAFEALDAKYRAMQAAEMEVDYLQERWRLLPVENGSASFLLEDLLDAQDRLADAEQGALEAALAFNLAQVGYKKAIGALLNYSGVDVSRGCDCRLPRQEIYQARPQDAASRPAAAPPADPLPPPVRPDATTVHFTPSRVRNTPAFDARDGDVLSLSALPDGFGEGRKPTTQGPREGPSQ